MSCLTFARRIVITRLVKALVLVLSSASCGPSWISPDDLNEEKIIIVQQLVKRPLLLRQHLPCVDVKNKNLNSSWCGALEGTYCQKGNQAKLAYCSTYILLEI